MVAAVQMDNFPSIDMVNGRDIMLVEPDHPAQVATAISTLLTDPAAARRVGEAGAALVRRHLSIDTVVMQHLEVLERIHRGSAERETGMRPGSARV